MNTAYKTTMLSSALSFLDSWNAVLNLTTPAHHKKIMSFLVGAYGNEPRRALLTAFRHSGKSTVVGIFAAFVLKTKPESRILILSAEQSLSSRMVGHIRHIVENHPECDGMPPGVKKEWASHKLTVSRPIGIREPSVICQGVHGNITGLRSDLIICDDVEVPNTANTAAKREMLRERLRELDFILSPDGCIIYIGTPHAADTIYRT
jgi:hypothetical protein